MPVRVSDVASISIERGMRSGAATQNSQEVVLGTVFMLRGENSRIVSAAVDKRLAEINKTLPAGVEAQTVYHRNILIDKVIETVKLNLAEGALLVISVLFVFLGNIRAAIITMLIIQPPIDRNSIGEGESVSVRVDLGGCLNIKKKK